MHADSYAVKPDRCTQRKATLEGRLAGNKTARPKAPFRLQQECLPLGSRTRAGGFILSSGRRAKFIAGAFLDVPQTLGPGRDAAEQQRKREIDHRGPIHLSSWEGRSVRQQKRRQAMLD